MYIYAYLCISMYIYVYLCISMYIYVLVHCIQCIYIICYYCAYLSWLLLTPKTPFPRCPSLRGTPSARQRRPAGPCRPPQRRGCRRSWLWSDVRHVRLTEEKKSLVVGFTLECVESTIEYLRGQKSENISLQLQLECLPLHDSMCCYVIHFVLLSHQFQSSTKSH